MEHLLRLRGVPEVALEGTSEFPVRRGYETARLFVVLSADGEGRLARIEFFSSREMSRQKAQYDYSGFQEVAEGVWIPCLHKAELSEAGLKVEETTRVSNLSVNSPVPGDLFKADAFFTDVEFVAEMDGGS